MRLQLEQVRAKGGRGGLQMKNLTVEAERHFAPSRNAEGMIEDCGALVKFEIFIGDGEGVVGEEVEGDDGEDGAG